MSADELAEVIACRRRALAEQDEALRLIDEGLRRGVLSPEVALGLLGDDR
jgi:hypothetical protein